MKVMISTSAVSKALVTKFVAAFGIKEAEATKILEAVNGLRKQKLVVTTELDNFVTWLNTADADEQAKYAKGKTGLKLLATLRALAKAKTFAYIMENLSKVKFNLVDRKPIRPRPDKDPDAFQKLSAAIIGTLPLGLTSYTKPSGPDFYPTDKPNETVFLVLAGDRYIVFRGPNKKISPSSTAKRNEPVEVRGSDIQELQTAIASDLLNGDTISKIERDYGFKNEVFSYFMTMRDREQKPKSVDVDKVNFVELPKKRVAFRVKAGARIFAFTAPISKVSKSGVVTQDDVAVMQNGVVLLLKNKKKISEIEQKLRITQMPTNEFLKLAKTSLSK
jgi:hypothetical protein